MIDTLRRDKSKKGLKLILWITIFSLVGGTFITLILLSNRFKNVLPAVAKVNGYDISFMDFRSKFAHYVHFINEIKKKYGSQAKAILQIWGIQEEHPEKQILEKTIQQKILQSAADKSVKEISKNYLEKKLQDPYFGREYLSDIVPSEAYQGGVLNPNILKAALVRQGISEEEFEDLFVELAKKIVFAQILERSVYIPLVSLKEQYIKTYAKRQFALMQLDKKVYQEKAQQDKLSDTMLQEYFDAHKEQYRIPEKRSGIQWIFKPDQYDIMVTKQDIETYYTQRKNEFIVQPEKIQIKRIVLPISGNTIEQRKKAAELHNEVREASLEEFERIAQQHSQAQDKGQTLTLEQGKQDPALETAAFNLHATNTVSPVIKTKEGFEIIKFINKQPAEYQSLEEAHDGIVKRVQQQKFKTAFSSDAQRIIKQAKDTPALFEQFIKEKKAQPQEIKNIIRDGSNKAEKLFDLAKPEDKTFYVENEQGAIMQLSQITPSELPEQATIEEKLKHDIYAKKAFTLLQADLEKAQKELESGKKLQDISSVLKGSITNTEWINPQEQDSFKLLLDKHISPEKIFALTEPKNSSIEIVSDAGYLIEVTAIESFSQEAFNQKKNIVWLQAYQTAVQPLFESFIKALRDKAQVHIYEDVLSHATSKL